MREVIFDLETNNVNPLEVTKIHSLVVKDFQGALYSCTDDDSNYLPIQTGIDILIDADRIIAHNGICYDIQVIFHLLGIDLSSKIYDTINASRLIWPSIIDIDYTKKYVPQEYKGKHSLAAWGHRLQFNKGDFGASTDWQHWSLAMQDYCELDVLLTEKIYYLQKSKHYSETALQLEFDFQKYINCLETCGAPFNTAKARELASELSVEKTKLMFELQRAVPPTITQLKTKTKSKMFNPASDLQFAKFLQQKYNWKPEVLTKTGRAQMNEEVLSGLTFPEAELVLKFKQVNNIITKLSDGDESWLKHVKNDRIYGRINTNGAVTGRCTHYKPNLGQVTSPRKYKGAEARSLFEAPDGFSFVGADASGLELRMLAHYLYPYDEGAYVEIILDGDVHTANKEAAGLPSRDAAKRFIYAHNYGAGDAKLGSIVLPDSPVNVQREKGKELKTLFRQKIKGLDRLIQDVEFKAKTEKKLRGIDGRILQIRETYRALNTLLQGGGAVVMKKAGVLAYHRLLPLIRENKVQPVLNVHDEMQFIALNDLAESVGLILKQSIIDAGVELNLKCPLDAEYKVGKTWKETH